MSEAMEGRSARRAWMPPARLAVSVMFLMNGYVVGSWAPKVPILKARLGIDETTLGFLILAFGLGSLALMPVAGGMIAREGSARVMRVAGLLAAVPLLLVTLAPNVGLAAVALFLLGGLVGGMDVAMNANAVSVERGMRRAIMSSCHGFWSLGGLIGSATGGVLIATLGPLGHAVVAVAAGVGAVALVWRLVAHDRPPAEAEAVPLRLPRTLLPWVLGVLALFCMIPEGAVLDWSALYLHGELGASLEVSGLAFAAFSATMAVMRFSGDPLRDRLGAVRMLRGSIVVAGVGLFLAGLAPGPGWAVAGFALAGLGGGEYRADHVLGGGQPAGPGAGHRALAGDGDGLFGDALRPDADRVRGQAYRARGGLSRTSGALLGGVGAVASCGACGSRRGMSVVRNMS